MFRKLVLSLFVLVALAIPSRRAHADLNIIASVPTLAAIAKEVGGDHVSVTSLSLHTQDPHFVDAKPSLALKLNKADLLLAVGLGLESGWLPVLQQGARNAKIQNGRAGYLECSKFARLLEKPRKVDRSEGDVHPGGNPHYLFDPRQIAHVAIGIAGRMAELDAANADAYKKNLKSLLKGLHKARIRLEAKMKDHRGAKVVAYHRSWAYLAEWLGLDQIAFLEPKPGIPPNPGHVAKVVKKCREHGVKVIMQETFYPSATSKKVAKLTHAKLAALPGGADFAGGETVAHYLNTLVSRLHEAFGG